MGGGLLIEVFRVLRSHRSLSSWSAVSILILVLVLFAKLRKLNNNNNKQQRLLSQRLVTRRASIPRLLPETPNVEQVRSRRASLEDNVHSLRDSTAAFGIVGQDLLSNWTGIMDKFELKKGDELFSPIKAELYEHGMFVVASGAVGMFRTRNVSVLRDFAFSVYKAGEVFGVYSLLMRDDVAKSKDYSYIFRCVALEDCCVHFLRRDSFQAFVEESPEKLEIFIRSVIAQEWRVSSSILNNYLGIHATPYHSLQNNGVPTVEEVSTEENSKSISRENSVSNLSVYEDAETKSEINIPKSLFAEELKIKRGHVLYEKGDLADSFYLVKEGQFELIGEHTKVSTLADQEILLGGIPFFTTTARLETAIAQQDSRVLKFTQESFSHLIETDTKYAFKLLKAVGEQLSTECQTFFELGLQKVWHKSGETIYEEGDEADSLHVVVSGRIRLSRNSESARKLSDLCGVQDKLDNSVFISPEKNLRAVDASQGDSFGEPSLITVCTSDSTETEILSKRLFNACAIRDSLIVRISKACLKRILRKHPSSMVKLSRSVSERFQDMVSRMNERAVFSTGGKVKIISLFPSGKATTALHVRSVSTRLQAILSESHGTVLKLNSAAVDSMVGYSITKQLHLNSEIAKLSSWLSEQEDLFNFILLESDCLVGMSEFDDDDQMMTDWDSFCIRQSDCIIHVGFSNQKENSELTKLEREFHAMYPNLECLRYLLLLHPALTRKPKNTKSWLEKRRVHCVQHVRVDFLPDWERIGRLLSGKSIGIVFGGGGARGMAHIGVIKALEERGIPIDMAGGTSQGAFIAGLYASRLSARGVELGAREYAFGFHLLSYLRSFTLPLLSYFEGTRFTNLVKNAFGEDDILDFWIPYFCISTSVSYSNVRVHQSGPAWKFIRASMTVIGLLPPIVNGSDDLLVDGGYSNNLPIDIMHQMPHRPKTLISVDVENRDASVFSNLYDYGSGISGFRVLWEMINPFQSFKKNVPSFGDIILFLNCISHMRQLRTIDESLVSMYINPPVTKYHLLDYPKLDELVEKGYESAKKVIDEWLEQNEDEFIRSRGSRQRKATAMAQARSRASLHLRSMKSEASMPNFQET